MRNSVARMACLILLLSACPVVWWLPRMPLFLAQQQWQNRPFRRYHLIADMTTYLMICHYDVIVDGVHVVAVNENWCDRLGMEYLEPLAPKTVNDHLHDLAQRSFGITCGAAGCRCGYPVLLEVDWHSELGYPKAWRKRRVATGFRLLPRCPADVGEGPVWEISHLEPWP